jgi:hypothetical protein
MIAAASNRRVIAGLHRRLPGAHEAVRFHGRRVSIRLGLVRC